MKQRDDERLVTAIRKALDAGIEHLPPSTVQSLQDARHQALAGKVKTHRPWLAVPRWVTAGSLATVSVMLLTVSLWVSGPQSPAPEADAELERIAAQEQIDLYEDLEFFRWLAENKKQ
jgi:hypothetical protein